MSVAIAICALTHQSAFDHAVTASTPYRCNNNFAVM